MLGSRHNSWQRARLVLWLRILGILAVGLAISGAAVWYATQHSPVNRNARPLATATPSATPLPAVLSAKARARIVATATARIAHLTRQATARGITVRVAAIGGVSPILNLVFGPLPVWDDVSGTDGMTLTDAWGRAIPLSSSAQGGCGNQAVYPVTCYTTQHFTRVVTDTPLVLTIKRLLVTRWKSRRQRWVTGPWTMTFTMP